MTAPSVYSLGDEVTSVNLAAYLRPLGKEVGSFGIRNRIWEVNSTVRNYFDSHLRPGILHHLNGLPESVSIRASINFTPYMIGRRSASATPTVLFTSDDEQLRKEARKLIKECGLLKEHRAWKTVHASKDPSWGGKLEQLAVGHESTGETHEASPVTRVLYDTTKSLRSKGMTLYVPHGPSLRAVTANLVCIKGRDYYLATAHTFFDRCSTPTPSSSEPGDDFEIDSNGEESTVWDARIQIDLPLPEYDGTSTCSRKSEPIESSSPEASDNENDSQSSLGSSARVNVRSADSQFTLTRGLPSFWTHAMKHGPSLYDIGEDEKDIQSTIEFIQKSAERKESQTEPANRQPATPSSNRLKLMGTLALWSTDKDWALIAIDSRNDPSLIAVLATDQEDLNTLQTISCKVPSGLVLTHTSSGGRMTGTIMSTLSDYRVPYGKSFQEVFAIKLDGSLADGDCGSAVTDAATGALYGHIVAGCRTSGFAYVMAAHHVFPDLQASVEQDMHFSSSSVAPTTDLTNDASSGPPGLSSGKVANLVTADSSHIQTSSNEFSSENDAKPEIQRQRWFEDAVKAKCGDMVKTYTKVVPLIIRWTETEEDIGRSHDEEVEELKAVFARFNFDASETIALTKDSRTQGRLKAATKDFVARHDGTDTLMIVYYTGHGALAQEEIALQPENRCNHAYRGNEVGHVPFVSWEEAEKSLLSDSVKADVLAILDCCYTGNGTLQNPQSSRVFELLAASPRIPPRIRDDLRPTSFTNALSRSLNALLEEKKPCFNTAGLQHMLEQQLRADFQHTTEQVPSNRRPPEIARSLEEDLKYIATTWEITWHKGRTNQPQIHFPPMTCRQQLKATSQSPLLVSSKHDATDRDR